MKKQILSLAILATLPLTAMAENISGDMYVAPTTATQNNPAPTTNASAPYGRIDIDTTDREHVASTAYVKGAYNSAIAAVNKLNTNLNNIIRYQIEPKSELRITDENDNDTPIENYVETSLDNVTEDNQLVNGMAIKTAVNALDTKIDNKRVEIYTTWDNDNAKTEVAFVNASTQGQ